MRQSTSRIAACAVAAAALLGLGACAQSNDHVIFVTRTALGVDFDSTPASVVIGFDRVEGYLGPRAGNGEVPPVLASIQSSGGVFNSEVRQTYATGDAAENLARGLAGNRPRPVQADARTVIAGDLEPMFFGTSTGVGLRVGFTANAPESLTFGFKREEVSVIPLARTGLDQSGRVTFRYPSVIAAIDTTADAGPLQGTGLRNAQFFATGTAAEAYALSEDARQAFGDRAREALQQFDAAEGRQRVIAGDIIVCYSALPPSQRPAVWRDAQRLQLLREAAEEGEDPPAADALLNRLLSEHAGSEVEQARANSRYVAKISQPSGFAPAREQLLEAHRQLVCTASAPAGG